MKKLILAGIIAAIAFASLPSASFAYGGGSPVVSWMARRIKPPARGPSA